MGLEDITLLSLRAQESKHLKYGLSKPFQDANYLSHASAVPSPRNYNLCREYDVC
jgi:hypothetical protein